MSRPLVLSRVPFQPPVQRNYLVDWPITDTKGTVPTYFQYDKLSQNTASCIGVLSDRRNLLLFCNIFVSQCSRNSEKD